MAVLVIDVGSSSVRTVLFDENGWPIPDAATQYKYRMNITKEGAAYFEMDALQAWIEACIDDILLHPAAQTIQAVGMATFVGNWIGLDAGQQPITPLFSYAETRASQDVATLYPIYHASDTHQRTGCPLHTAYMSAQVTWLRRTHSELFYQIAQFVDLGGYLYRRWFGVEAPTSYSCASWTGLLNRLTLCWDDQWLAALDIPLEKLASLADYTYQLVGLQADYETRWPQLQGVPIFLAVGDGAAANVGMGAIDERSIAITVGTTAAVRMMTAAPAPRVPDGLWAYRVDAHRHLIGGATNEGGNVYKWLRAILDLPADYEAQIAARRGMAHGLTFVPLLAGERSPGWNSRATGTLQGLRLTTTAVDILQAGLEGVAQRLKTIIDRLPNDDAATIYASGGALRSGVWPTIIADALGREIKLVDFAESTARGCACMVLSHLRNRPLQDFPPLPNQSILPLPHD